MKVKLIDVEENPTEELTGTCEFCFETIDCDNPVFVFQLVGSNQEIRINGYWWDYDYYDEVAIPNIINFADWLDHQEFPDDTVLDTDWLINVADKYNSIYTPYRDVNGKLIKVGYKIKVTIKFNQGKHIEFVSKVHGDDCNYYVSNGGDDYDLYELYDPREYWCGINRTIDNATVEVVQ